MTRKACAHDSRPPKKNDSAGKGSLVRVLLRCSEPPMSGDSGAALPMPRPLKDDSLPHVRWLLPMGMVWACLALAAVAVALLVFGCLHAGRPFWRLACEHSSNLSSLQA